MCIFLFNGYPILCTMLCAITKSKSLCICACYEVCCNVHLCTSVYYTSVFRVVSTSCDGGAVLLADPVAHGLHHYVYHTRKELLSEGGVTHMTPLWLLAGRVPTPSVWWCCWEEAVCQSVRAFVPRNSAGKDHRISLCFDPCKTCMYMCHHVCTFLYVYVT